MNVSPVGTAEAKQSPPVILRWNCWALAPLALVAAAGGVPFFLNHGFLVIGLALERGFTLVCHQRPERSFWIFGGSVAVCSRCMGIYIGAACGLLFRTTRAIALRLLIAAVALNLLDVGTEWAGLHGNWLGVRLALGFVLGATAALLISSSVPGESDQSQRLPSLRDSAQSPSSPRACARG
ncbi:MAG TPA: DUF2085 domain-containing protein [Terracidiphilus sp.]|nr:DUF2085 domain-containing protein [Terracidiphilus sp.]